jgi:hypothetical protein
LGFGPYAIKYLSWFHIQYYDKWCYILHCRVNTFVVYYSLLRFGVGYCPNSSSSLRSSDIGVYQRRVGLTLMSIRYYSSLPFPPSQLACLQSWQGDRVKTEDKNLSNLLGSELIEWLRGFTDASGCFSIKRIQHGYPF